MKANDALSRIPVVPSVESKGHRGLKWKRQVAQISFLILLILIPALGIFRIDVSTGFIVFNRQVWFSDFLLVFGFWLALACTMILVYSSVGTAFCGWACPQNTFSTLANKLTGKYLGKRAVIDWEGGDRAKLASRKNKPLNWILLGFQILLMSLFIALIPMFYFLPPDAMWSFVTFQADARVTGSLYWIYSVFVFIFFANFAVIRHFVCRYMCVYRMWQFLFKTRDTLHIEYDESRKSDCDKCNFCVTSCMVEIDPRKTNFYDSCTNCGACITACDTMHKKDGRVGLLSFKFGPQKGAEKNPARSIATFKERAIWVTPVWLIGMGLFIWGLINYQPFHLAVYTAGKTHGQQIDEYRINLASKLFDPATIAISVEGLEEKNYTLSASDYHFEGAGRGDVFIKLHNLQKGLHSFVVRAKAGDDWNAFYRVQHFVSEE